MTKNKQLTLHKNFLNVLIIAIILLSGCAQESNKKSIITANYTQNFEEEKAAILEVLNNETKAAFNRDYEGWKEYWVHESYVSKTYMQFQDSSMTETLGWGEIDAFVKTYIEEHPEPAPLPEFVNEINVRLYGNGAWVNYEQNDAKLGLKRETRLMEKINGKWKIAGMHTSIYGFNYKSN